jgi:hypothetical protein
LEIEKYKRIMGWKIILVISLFTFSCQSTNSERETDTFSNKDIEGKNVVEAIDIIALTNPKFEGYRADEIHEVISKIDDPKLLFDYFVLFDKKRRDSWEKKDEDDIKCPYCQRYEIALDAILHRFSELKSDDATKYLVLIVEKEIISGSAHFSETLIEGIAAKGKSALPYLKKIDKSNYLAGRAIEIIEKETN